MEHPTSFTPLTPLSFLERSAEVFADKLAIVAGDRRMTYREVGDAAQALARALRAAGITPGDRVACLLPNIPEQLVAHFGVPLAGAVLVAINTRLASGEVRTILEHSRARIVLVDTELSRTLEPVVGELTTVERIVAVDDVGVACAVDAEPYDAFVASGAGGEPLPWGVDDELGTISVNYTSGTTGQPKGVQYTHRGAYLNALAEVIHSRHGPESTYLWTLPMFHCNGWCTTWGVTAVGGTHVCLRAVRGDAIWRRIREEGITHLNGAPTVLTTIASAPEAAPLDRPITVTTAGAPPSPTIIARMEALGFRVVHVYGLTETYGPHTVCEVQPGWADLPDEERAARMARQGVAMVVADPIRVVDDELRDVPRDGTTMGEVVMRGNNVMKGYLDDPEATERAFRGGWFHSGDLGVWHPDGAIQLKDRAKDIIVSGGENISTIEVEQAVLKHPAVHECAVIGVPDERWGERPKAFVVVTPGATVTEDELRAHVRGLLAGYKVPDRVDLVDALPTTSTGKIQKFALREKEWAGHDARIN